MIGTGLAAAERRSRVARPPFVDHPKFGTFSPEQDLTFEMPDILEFVISDKYLYRGIYPRQATFLKLMFLQDDCMTEYDIDVLDQWAAGFKPPNVEEGANNTVLVYEGGWGIAPDWRERIKICKAEGRLWFKEVDAVLGRRSGKGYMGGLAGAYVLYFFIMVGDVRKRFGIDRDKRLEVPVFAGKMSQARDNQWRDLRNVIMGAPCFQPFISKALNESLSLYARTDIHVFEEYSASGRDPGIDYASFRMVPKESTVVAGRGPASIAQFYDEMAWIIPAVAATSAEELYRSATPALDQVKPMEFIYAGSSPWQMMGQFYESSQAGLSFDPNTGLPLYPTNLMLQLQSWDIYKDWEIADKMALYPDNYKKITILGNGYRHERAPQVVETEGRHKGEPMKTFPTLVKAIQAFDSEMKRKEKLNPESFRVEYRAQWATTMDAYLDREKIKTIWMPFNGRELQMQTQGGLATRYVAHGDPATVHDTFGFAIAHLEGPDERGYPHVVFDVLHAWRPGDFADNHINYVLVEEELKSYIRRFNLELLTFDQFNSPGIIDHLRAFERQARLPKRCMIDVQTATGPLNWTMAETFKTALNMGLIHAPYMEQADLELQFLEVPRVGRVDHPSSGPVQSKDVFDAMANVTYNLIGDEIGALFADDLNVPLMGAAVPGGTLAPSSQDALDRSIHDRMSAISMRSRRRPGTPPPRRGLRGG